MEAEFVDWLRKSLPSGDRCIVKLGDDAAVFDWRHGDHCVVTTDLLADGVHFVWNEQAPSQIGRKAVAVNLSDLAAMAAAPTGIVISLLLPSSTHVREDCVISSTQLQELYRGMLPLARQFDFEIAGGDTNTWEGAFAISVTAFGVCDQSPLQRSGAQVGDLVLVTGSLGGSRMGHHLEFTPRIHEAILLNRRYKLHAGLDISDGLALDASRLATSSHCGIELDTAAVPISSAAIRLHQANPTGPSPLARALGDGEDFELLLAVPPDAADGMLRDQPLDVPLTRVGRVIREPGLWQRTPENQRRALPITGYQHE